MPPTIFRLDTVTGKHEVFFQPKIPFDSSQFELKQVFFKSKDGTQVPMFIAGKKGLKQTGTESVADDRLRRLRCQHDSVLAAGLLHGGLQQGGWFCGAHNLRGERRGEYGETWHEQGLFEKKQNVFDDWFAAAEYLIANKYTSPWSISPLPVAPTEGLLDGCLNYPAP